MKYCRLFLISFVFFAVACSKCDQERAYNKMLALNKVQARIAAQPGDAGPLVAASMSRETSVISELIAQKKYEEACTKAEEFAKKYDIDLKKEQKNMITYEQLQADGGRGSGTCSVADAAKMQMELHGMLQKEVNEGKRDSNVFREFNRDTQGYAEMLATNPSAACKLFEDLKEKYAL